MSRRVPLKVAIVTGGLAIALLILFGQHSLVDSARSRYPDQKFAKRGEQHEQQAKKERGFQKATTHPVVSLMKPIVFPEPARMTFDLHAAPNTAIFDTRGKLRIGVANTEVDEVVSSFFASGASKALADDWRTFPRVNSSSDLEPTDLRWCDESDVTRCDVVVDLKTDGHVESYDLVVSAAGMMIRIRPGLSPADAALKPKPAPWSGLLYAFHSLFSLAVSGTNTSYPHVARIGVIPATTILDDRPKMRWRGLHIDTARHFFGLSTLKNVVHRMAKVKLNVLHMHLADDQGWRLESKQIPSLHLVGGRRGPALNGRTSTKHNGSAYLEPVYHTQEDIESLIEFAALRNIHIVPEIDLPAHAAAIVAGLDAANNDTLTDFGYIAKEGEGNADCGPLPRTTNGKAPFGAPNCMGGTFGMMYPSPKAFEILKIILGEVCQLFPRSPFIHVGGDQAEFLRSKAWAQSNPMRKTFFKEFDEKDLAKSQGMLTTKTIKEIVKSAAACHSLLPDSDEHRSGRTAVVWDETYLELGKDYAPPSDTHVMLWRNDDLSEIEARAKRQMLQQQRVDDVDKEGKKVEPRRLPLIVAPKQRTYFDYVQHHPYHRNRYGSQQRPPGWAKYKAVTLRRTFMTHKLTWDHKVLDVAGFHGAVWSELLKSEEMLMYQLVPRLYALADVAWRRREFEGADDGADTPDERYALQYKKFIQGLGRQPARGNASSPAPLIPLKVQYHAWRDDVDRWMLLDPV